jgi:hypothetical protein
MAPLVVSVRLLPTGTQEQSKLAEGQPHAWPDMAVVCAS